MRNILLLLGASWLAYAFYGSEYYYNIDFWGAILPVAYLVTFGLLITSR